MVRLIVNCYIGRLDSSKNVYRVSSNPDIIMTGIIGVYDLRVMVDLLPFLLTENLAKWADFSGTGNLN